MIKKITHKIVISFFLLYWFNKIGSNFNMIIPINLITLIITFFCDIPGIGMLILSLIVLF